MHVLTQTRSLSALMITSCWCLMVHAQQLRSTDVLRGPETCRHVIGLLQIHGVNNSVDLSAASLVAPPPIHGPFVMALAELGDLRIAQVTQLPAGAPDVGPQIAIVVHNASDRTVRNFHLTAVGFLGQIHPHSPSTTVRVEQLNPGQQAEFVVQLPIEVTALGNRDGQILGFQRLLVAIDSFDQLLETNEANNLRAFRVSDLPIVTSSPTSPSEQSVPSAPEVTPDTSGSLPDAVPAPAPNARVRPSSPGNTESLRSAIRMMEQPTDRAVATKQ